MGSGLGTFREAFRRVQPRELNELIEHAHNDTLQLLVTGGVIATSLAVVGVLTLGAQLAMRSWRQTGLRDSIVGLAALSALVSLLLHGLADFNLSIPAIPATLAVMVAVGWSATTHRRRKLDM